MESRRENNEFNKSHHSIAKPLKKSHQDLLKLLIVSSSEIESDLRIRQNSDYLRLAKRLVNHSSDSLDLQEVWRLCTKTKSALSSGTRIENLSWRLSSMNLQNIHRQATSPLISDFPSGKYYDMRSDVKLERKESICEKSCDTIKVEHIENHGMISAEDFASSLHLDDFDWMKEVDTDPNQWVYNRFMTSLPTFPTNGFESSIPKNLPKNLVHLEQQEFPKLPMPNSFKAKSQLSEIPKFRPNHMNSGPFSKSQSLQMSWFPERESGPSKTHSRNSSVSSISTISGLDHTLRNDLSATGHFITKSLGTQSPEPISAVDCNNSIKQQGSVKHDDRQTICFNCKSQSTPLWRRDKNGNSICNACGLFLRLHGINRPMSMRKDSFVRKKSRNVPFVRTRSSTSVNQTLEKVDDQQSPCLPRNYSTASLPTYENSAMIGIPAIKYIGPESISQARNNFSRDFSQVAKSLENTSLESTSRRVKDSGIDIGNDLKRARYQKDSENGYKEKSITDTAMSTMLKSYLEQKGVGLDKQSEESWSEVRRAVFDLLG